MQQRSQCCTSWRFCTGAARLETFFSTKVGLLLASCLLVEITQGTILQLQEHQDENIQQPSDPTQQTWYQGTSCKSVGQKQGPLTQPFCLLSLVITLLKRTFLVQNQFREKITAATQKVMWQKGFYPGDTEYDMIAMIVLSKPNLAAAKADYQLYVDLIKRVSKAHKGC